MPLCPVRCAGRGRKAGGSNLQAGATCAAGFTLLKGDVPGNGKVGEHGGDEPVANCDACADFCRQDENCNSYECNPNNPRCNLNTGADPTAGQAGDQLYCRKDNAKGTTCAAGFTLRQGDIPGNGKVGAHGGDEPVANCDKCADFCRQDENCNSYECNPYNPRCNLNLAGEPNAGQAGTQLYCKKDNGKGQTCAAGYTLLQGDIPGNGKVGDHGGAEEVPNCDKCAEFCTQSENCNSYECSPYQPYCNLNTGAEPTTGQAGDQLFCKKNNPKAQTCAANYTLLQGDIPGNGKVGDHGGAETVPNCDKCAEFCTQHEGCNSYECDPYNPYCNLNVVADPTTGQVGTQLFCKKNDAKGQVCAAGYQSLEGDIPGWGSLGGHGDGEAVVHCDKCAELCKATPGCNSYECSKTALKCNLNSGATPTAGKFEDYMFCKADGITVFSGANYTGKATTLPVGTYNHCKKTLPLGNDPTIKSIRVPQGFKVTLWQDCRDRKTKKEALGGSFAIITTDTAELYNLSYTISAVVVEKA